MSNTNIRRCYKCGREYDYTKLLSLECPVCKTVSLVMINPLEYIPPTPCDIAPADKKYDQGKDLVALMKKDFSKALVAVAEVTTYGVKKYKQPGSWRYVENGYDRYEDALGRHDLAMMTDRNSRDEESNLLHAAHRAWNALATLEMIITEDKRSDGI